MTFFTTLCVKMMDIRELSLCSQPEKVQVLTICYSCNSQKSNIFLWNTLTKSRAIIDSSVSVSFNPEDTMCVKEKRLSTLGREETKTWIRQ